MGFHDTLLQAGNIHFKSYKLYRQRIATHMIAR